MPKTRPLFAPSEVKLQVAKEKTGKGGRTGAVASQATRIKTKTTQKTFARRLAKCAEVVGRIERGESMHLVSSAEWSSHNLIEHLIEQTGPIALWFATWSIGEDGLRSVLRMRDAGSLLSINAVLDWRALTVNPEAVQYVKAQADQFAVYACHAKIYVLRNKSWGLSIVSSANMTNNPRIEASVIAEDRKLADWHIAWLSDVIRGADPFEVGDG